MRIRKSQKLFTVWKEGNKYEQSKTLVCSCAGGIDAVSAYACCCVAEEASDGKMIVYAKLPSDWSDPHLWAWADDGTNAFDAWPGGEMEADSNNDGWYYCWHYPKPPTTLLSMRMMQRFRPVTTSWKARMLGSR